MAQPRLDHTFFKLGNALKMNGRLDAAITAYRQAIAVNADFPEAHNNLGVALKDKGEIIAATAEYRTAIALNPNFPEAWCNLGVVLREAGQLEEAIAACRQAVVLKQDFPEAFSNLGIALTANGQLDEAIAACRQAIALKPMHAEAHNSLGNALQSAGQLQLAIAAYRQAVLIKPNYADAHGNLGNALRASGDLDAAIIECGRAVELNPNSAEAHRNLALALLANGDLARGWEEHEWRWKCRDFPTPMRNFRQPLWDGRLIENSTLLIHAEQGLGDTIQFIRYLGLVRQRCAKIVIECQAPLRRLIQTVAGDCTVVAQGEMLPAFDWHCPLLTLPLVFATTLETIPCETPYLFAEADLASQWCDRLAAHSGDSFKVGLAWAGNASHGNDRNRSISLAAFAPLAGLSGVSFYSLQKGERATDAKSPPDGITLSDWTEDLSDFADTAALIAGLDLVISVDTAVAHLAGAMGKPVWVLLPFAPDWRWMFKRDGSPWYPTMRLFRQRSIGNWAVVMEEVANAAMSITSVKFGQA